MLEELRKEIESIDKQMVELFEKRMNVVSKIKEYKKNNNLSLVDLEREELLHNKNKQFLYNKDYEEYYDEFLDSILYLSKKFQNK